MYDIFPNSLLTLYKTGAHVIVGKTRSRPRIDYLDFAIEKKETPWGIVGNEGTYCMEIIWRIYKDDFPFFPFSPQ